MYQHVAVTGGAGFVGSHIVERLLRSGHHVVVIDNGSTCRPNTVEGALYVGRDITKDRLDDALAGVDWIVHAAAYADIAKNWLAPEERERTWTVNAVGTQRVLEAAPVNTRVIYLSTASVYGTQPTRIVRPEDAKPWTQESPYSASKFAGEGIVAAYAYARRSTWQILRLVNVVGSRYHHGHLADFVQMASDGDGVIRARDNGHQRKSFVHVADVAELVTACIDRTLETGIYNVASEERWSIRDSLRCMGPVRVEFRNAQQGWPGDPYELAVDSRPATLVLGRWRSVEQGVREALASLGWHQQPGLIPELVHGEAS